VTGSPFKVDITDLLRGSTGTRPERFEAPVDWHLGETAVGGDQPIDVDLTLARISGGVVIFGTVMAAARSTCDRCLNEFEAVLSTSVQASLLFKADEDDEDAYIIDSPKVDLQPIVRDEVLLGLPVQSLCRTDCVGLVEYVESDLNTDPHATDAPGSPFRALRDLLETRE
jgi:DUF177 domain-containing protein